MANEYLIGINGKVISKKLKTEILKNEKSFKKEPFEKKSDNSYYRLADGRIIYEVMETRYYLFDSMSEFEKFTSRIYNTEPISNFLSSYTHPLEDNNFIENKDRYVNSFLSTSRLDINFDKVETLKVIDDFLIKRQPNEIESYMLQLVAIIGEYVKKEIGSEASWKYLTTTIRGKKFREPVISGKGKNYISNFNF